MLEYIAGFFDADGSVTLTKHHKNESKSPQVSFHNNERIILEEIKSYFGCGSISTKKPKRGTCWKVSYDLKFSQRRALHVLQEIYPYMRHPEKVRKALLLLEGYKEVTPRNGRYSKELRQLREDFEEKFFNGYT